MAKLTMSEVAGRLGVSVYTIKRWYQWYESESQEKIDELIKKGMPTLPKYETISKRQWRYWDEEDIPQLQKFKEFIPHTRGGFMGSLNKKGE